MSLRNTEVVRAMGMTEGLLKRWGRDRNRMLERQVTASDRAATMQSMIRFLRLSMQSLILGLGAYLVIERLATAGAMFAASILLGRALQPVEQIVGSWRNLVSARGAFLRVRELLSANPPRDTSMSLPRPEGRLDRRGLTFVPPLTPSRSCAGSPSGSSPAKYWASSVPPGPGSPRWRGIIVGVLMPSAGAVRLDGADVARLGTHVTLGHHLGYLPQDIELFSDTVAANISRFQEGEDQDVDPGGANGRRA